MDIERFHNELAMRLGYERLVRPAFSRQFPHDIENDKKIHISIEESEDPLVTLRIDGYNDIKLKASESPDIPATDMTPEMRDEIKWISEAVHQAYIESTRNYFSYCLK